MESLNPDILTIAEGNVAVIIAHPDDETLWTGGMILNHPSGNWFIVCLCRGRDSDRAPRFHKALQVLNAKGIIGNLDDGPEQIPLDENEVSNAILSLIPSKQYDLIITHNPEGEYTKHRRHEEIGKAVIKLWYAGMIRTHELWVFAYEDGGKAYYPRAIEKATIFLKLAKQIWLKKYKLLTETYGFKKNSWEAETTPRSEAFYRFTKSAVAMHWLETGKFSQYNRV
jgi:LmbE family N-acetylglucosaminyl deacetylase